MLTCVFVKWLKAEIAKRLGGFNYMLVTCKSMRFMHITNELKLSWCKETQMAPEKSIGYSGFYNRYKMIVIIEIYGRNFTLSALKDTQFLLKF